jgi:hypothetical protein
MRRRAVLHKLSGEGSLLLIYLYRPVRSKRRRLLGERYKIEHNIENLTIIENNAFGTIDGASYHVISEVMIFRSLPKR